MASHFSCFPTIARRVSRSATAWRALLPDLLAKRIIESEILPAFRAGDFDAGVTRGVSAILQATRGEYRGSRAHERRYRRRRLRFLDAFRALYLDHFDHYRRKSKRVAAGCLLRTARQASSLDTPVTGGGGFGRGSGGGGFGRRGVQWRRRELRRRRCERELVKDEASRVSSRVGRRQSRGRHSGRREFDSGRDPGFRYEPNCRTGGSR